MKYVINDEMGDQIVVAPSDPVATHPRIQIRFTEGDSEATMVLSDRQAGDLKKAINQCLRESERIG